MIFNKNPAKKPLVNLLALGLLSAVIASCSWMREAPLPNANPPGEFKSSESMIRYSESLPYLAWWQQFNDPTLNQLIESAINNNLDLKVALQRMQEAKAQLTTVELSWVPMINAMGGYTTNPALGAAGTFYGIWPQYTLNIANIIQNQRYAKYQFKEYEANLNAVRLTLIGQVCASYFTLIAQQRQLNLLNQLNQDVSELVELIAKQQHIGLVSNINVADILSKQKQIQAQISSTQHNIRVSENSLRYILDENPGNVAAASEFMRYDFDQIHPGDLPANVLANRPDIIMAQYEVQKSHAGVGVAVSNLFPTIQLDQFMGAANLSKSLSNPTSYIPMTDAYLNWGIDPTTFGQIEAQKGAYYAQVYAYIQTVRKALRDTDNSLSANINFTTRYQQVYASYLDYQRKYKLQEGLYNSGLMAYLELIQNKIELDNLSIASNQAKLEQAISLVNLYQELAGGYKYQYASESTVKSKYINQ